MCTYNAFIPEENDYNDDNDEVKDPTTVLKHQKRSTWLYILLLICKHYFYTVTIYYFHLVSLYILFYTTVINSQPRTIIISAITLEIYKQLYVEHEETLSCRCSRITMPYQGFVSDTVTFHPVCSSHFVKRQWIEALNSANASMREVADFRTTAKSQVS
jgi:hypothetical protein